MSEVIHACTESGRFDRLERSLEAINTTLSTLSELLIKTATSDIRINTLEEKARDIENRMRTIEHIVTKNLWIERIIWGLVLAIVLAFFKLG